VIWAFVCCIDAPLAVVKDVGASGLSNEPDGLKGSIYRNKKRGAIGLACVGAAVPLYEFHRTDLERRAFRLPSTAR
jgi:hypothetical protein